MTVATDDVVIRCRGVVKRFGDVVALDELDLAVGRGTVVGYLGPNGAGKSTTIRILLDLARPDAGDVSVLGADPRTAGPKLRRRIGYLPGELRLDDRLRVDETLRSWIKLRGGSIDENYVRSLCDRLDLDITRQTRGLSSGNRRKVGLVGAFMARPELLVLDEPTAGVDPLVQATFLELVGEARDDGRTVFLSSHVLSEVQQIADAAIVIRAGKVVATGRIDDLRQAARQPFTAWFAGPPPEAALRSATGVAELDVRGNEVSGVIEGPPNGLLAVLARHPVDHLLMPEPDLEQAFLRYYEGGGGS
ncbi:MAG TPA: ABC transporter ATP-binding protein [Ilumatobacteraceae bacterium]